MKRIIILTLSLYFLTAQAEQCDESTLKALIPGHYTVVGRLPNSDKTFSSIMDIKANEDHTFIAIEKIKSKVMRKWNGYYKNASPGEGCVLHLVNKQNKLACLVSIDLDNYARLTCLWKNSNQNAQRLGLVALFPTPNE